MDKKSKVNIEINNEDKYNLLKEGPDYEDYSNNFVKESSKMCRCSNECKCCRKN